MATSICCWNTEQGWRALPTKNLVLATHWYFALYDVPMKILRSMKILVIRTFWECRLRWFPSFSWQYLCEDGISAGSRHVPTISIEEESLLWEKGVLNDSTSRCLLRAVFCYNFILQVGQEHRDLKLLQFKRLTNSDLYVYTGNASKSRGGGLGQLSLEHKRVPVYASGTGESKCHVWLLDKYITMLPTSVKQWQFLLAVIVSGIAWFSVQPCGKNYLAKMVPTMCAKAGMEEKKTHNSLRTAGVSQLFEAGVDEKLIQSRSVTLRSQMSWVSPHIWEGKCEPRAGCFQRFVIYWTCWLSVWGGTTAEI